MGTININGRSFRVPSGGVSVSVVNNKVRINGKLVSPENEKWKNPLDIRVSKGVLLNIQSEGDVECGDVKGYIRAKGSVVVNGSVGGYADAGGSITCGNVQGNVDAGGSVTAGSVSGNVDAGGSVMHG